MRKVTIIMCIILILTLSTTCFVSVKIYDSRDEVTLTEMNSWGNKDSLQDLTMQLNIMYKDRLRWKTMVPIGNPEKALTRYTATLTPVYADLDRDTGLNMDSSINTSMVQEHILQGNLNGITKAYAKLADTIRANEEAEKEIYLKDYIDYYQYTVELDIPGTRFYEWGTMSQNVTAKEQEKYTIDKLNEFFKIPVLEDECHSITIGKNEHGEIYHTGSGNGESDLFYMWTFNAIAENELYFTFDTHSRDGVVVDTSLIPEGYGIYGLPFDSTLEGSKENADRISADVDRLKMVYALDPQIEVMHLQLNGKKDKLLLHAEENGKYVVTVIDVSTMKTLQKIEIMEWDKDYGYQVYEDDDFIVSNIHKVQEEGKIEAVVLAENEKGEYEIAFISEIQNKNIPTFNTSNMYLAFDGKRLAMAGFLEDEEQDYRETCNIFLAVCDASGMQYYGEYRNSLETGYDAERYYYHCQQDGLEPIVLKWQ